MRFHRMRRRFAITAIAKRRLFRIGIEFIFGESDFPGKRFKQQRNRRCQQFISRTHPKQRGWRKHVQ